MPARNTPTPETQQMLAAYARMAVVERPEQLSPEEAGRALVDLLLLAEALPRRDRSQTLVAPRFPAGDAQH